MLLLIGRTGAGKSTIAKLLTELKPVVSYCDRPPREDETNGVEHIFVSKDEFTELYNTKDAVAYTVINGTRYMALREQCTDDSVYVIDPVGFAQLDYDNIYVVYVWADEQTRHSRTEGRDYDFDARNESEDGQFSEFESMGLYDLWVDAVQYNPEQIAEQIREGYNNFKHK